MCRGKTAGPSFPTSLVVDHDQYFVIRLQVLLREDGLLRVGVDQGEAEVDRQVEVSPDAAAEEDPVELGVAGQLDLEEDRLATGSASGNLIVSCLQLKKEGFICSTSFTTS